MPDRVSAYILIQTEVGKAASVAQRDRRPAGRHQRRGRHRALRRHRARRGADRGRAGQAGGGQGAGRRRDHPHADLPGRPPLASPTQPARAAGAEQHRHHPTPSRPDRDRARGAGHRAAGVPAERAPGTRRTRRPATPRRRCRAVTVAAPPTPDAGHRGRLREGVREAAGPAGRPGTAPDRHRLLVRGGLGRSGGGGPLRGGQSRRSSAPRRPRSCWTSTRCSGSPIRRRTRTVYTTVDRAVYIEVTVPAGADQPLPLLAAAVRALPATCTGTDAAGNPGAELPICGG